MTFLENHREIQREYLRESQQLVQNLSDARILKIDAWNEGRGDLQGENQNGIIDIGSQLNSRIFLLEIDKKICIQAKKQRITCGDLRHTPFQSETFSAILDLSTLDHILFQDLGPAMREYNRILKPGGRILLIEWVSDAFREGLRKGHSTQFFLNKSDYRMFFSRFFIIEEERVLKHSSQLLTYSFPHILYLLRGKRNNMASEALRFSGDRNDCLQYSQQLQSSKRISESLILGHESDA